MMTLQILRTSAAVVSVILATAATASAAVITITEAEFVAPTTVAFVVEGSWGGEYPPYVEAGATFSTTAPEFFYTYEHSVAGDNIADLWAIVAAGSSIDVAFDQGLDKFGFHAGTNLSSSESGMADYDVTSVMFYSDAGFINLVESYNVSTRLSDTGQTFFGLQSTSPFQSIRINLGATESGGGFSPYMDDFLIEESITAIPEPASIGLLALGLSWAGLRRRNAKAKREA